MTRRISAENEQKIFDLYKLGLSRQKIATLLKISRTTVTSRLDSLGPPVMQRRAAEKLKKLQEPGPGDPKPLQIIFRRNRIKAAWSEKTSRARRNAAFLQMGILSPSSSRVLHGISLLDVGCDFFEDGPDE